MMFNVALLQMAAQGADQEANLAKGEAFCRRAAGLGADIALFPEMWNIGYRFFVRQQTGAREAWAAQAIGPEDLFFQRFQALARELDMAIALTYLERWPGAPRNAVSIIDRRGEVILTYAKVHTCAWDVEGALTPGEDFPVCTLETRHGPVRVGCMICFDREFPEPARLLMLQGAEVILTPNACGLELNRLTQLRTRAWENMVGIATCNYAAPQENGHSVAYDGVGFDEQERSLDTMVVEAGGAEGVYLAAFDLDRLRRCREHEVWGNAFRRPQLYGLLTSERVEAPFLRTDWEGRPWRGGRR